MADLDATYSPFIAVQPVMASITSAEGMRADGRIPEALRPPGPPPLPKTQEENTRYEMQILH